MPNFLRIGLALLLATMMLMTLPPALSQTSGAAPIAVTSGGMSLIDTSSENVGITTPQVSPGGQLRPFTHAVMSLPYSLDPSATSSPTDYGILQNFYETLVWYDEGDPNNLVPFLSTQVPSLENGLISSDGLHYTYPIREGVLFHDGTEMDAYDVEYSIERIFIRNDPVGIGFLLGKALLGYTPDPYTQIDPWVIDSMVTVIDPWTVQVNLAVPFPGFNALMATQGLSIVSKDYVFTNEPDSFGNQNYWMSTHEMGTGPYMVSYYDPYSSMTLSRFDGYWMAIANIETINVVSIWDDMARNMLLWSGYVDIALVAYSDIPAFAANPDLKLYWGDPEFTVSCMGLNQLITPGLSYGNVPSDFFADARIRNAFICSMDVDAVNSYYFGVDMLRTNGPIPQGMWGYPSWPSQNLNLSLAGFLLSQVTNPSTGNSWAEDGFNIVFYYNLGNPYRQGLLNSWKNGLESLHDQGYVSGEITVDVIGLDWPVYLDARQNGQLAAFTGGWFADYADPDNFVKPFLHENGEIASFYHINDDELDQMIDDAALEMDKDARTEMYEDIVIDANQKGLYLWTYQDITSTATRSWVDGFYTNPMLDGQHNNAYYYALSWSAQLPEAPVGLTATANGDHIDLSWLSPPTSGSLPVESFSIYRSEAGGDLLLLNTVSAQMGEPFQYEDFSVIQGVEYVYCVSASNALGESAMSQGAQAMLTLEMMIDICPYQYPNVINLNGRGMVKVAVLSSAWFCAINVDRKTVRFAGAAPISFSITDLNGDGLGDVVFFFKASALKLDPGSTHATLTAKTFDGKYWSASDSVLVVRRSIWMP
jgi:peptide/nickel transport system substrate-binding protein